MLETSDEMLVEQAQTGDAQALGEIYDRHHERIFRYVWARVNNQQLAEDLTGEIFTRMVKRFVEYRAMGVPFQAWLYRIAHNLLVDYFRQENGRFSVPLEEAEMMSKSKDTPEQLVDTLLTMEAVQHALEKLDPLQKDVIVLRFLVGLPLQEVADTLDKTVAAIKSIQHRGLVVLRHELQGIHS